MQGNPEASWRSRGWMSFTLAAGAVLHLSGANRTVPTAQLSVANFLASGIPQINEDSVYRLAELNRDTNGHSIKHAVIEIVSVAVVVAAGTPEGRSAQDGSTPTDTLGRRRLQNDEFRIVNEAAGILNFKLFNRSAGNMVVEMEVFE